MIPDSICNITALTTLHLVSLKIDSIPDIGSLSNLRDLYIESCYRIKELPIWDIWDLTSLHKLGLMDLKSLKCMNEYTLQMGLYNLTSLTTLHVDKLEYVSLDNKEIGVLKNLKNMKIVKLKGLDFPVSFKIFRHLENLHIRKLPEVKYIDFKLFKTVAASLPYLKKLENFVASIDDSCDFFICPKSQKQPVVYRQGFVYEYAT